VIAAAATLDEAYDRLHRTGHAAMDVYARTGNPGALAAAVHAAQLIERRI